MVTFPGRKWVCVLVIDASAYPAINSRGRHKTHHPWLRFTGISPADTKSSKSPLTEGTCSQQCTVQCSAQCSVQCTPLEKSQRETKTNFVKDKVLSLCKLDAIASWFLVVAVAKPSRYSKHVKCQKLRK